jgi:hypothetical protein
MDIIKRRADDAIVLMDFKDVRQIDVDETYSMKGYKYITAFVDALGLAQELLKPERH